MDNKLMKKNENNFVPRITQLDSNEFDREIHSILYHQLQDIRKYLSPGTLNFLQADLKLLLRLLIFKYSVLSRNSTFGQELLGLRYKNTFSKKQAVLFVLLNYLLPYGNQKYEENSRSIKSDMFKKIIEKIEVFIKVFKFLNLIIFLREGKYPTLTDRLLKLEFSPVKLNRNVGYNYMTRELLWDCFMELLKNVSPLINLSKIKQKVTKCFLKLPSNAYKKKKTIDFHANTKCIICNDYPVLPCQISSYCSHLGCYYCLQSNLLADEKFSCPGCGETNTVHKNIRFL